MSFMAYGITHCRTCREPYRNGFECECTRKEKRKRQEKLDMLLDMTEDEIKALKILVKEKSQEIKKERIKEEINNLEKQLGE